MFLFLGLLLLLLPLLLLLLLLLLLFLLLLLSAPAESVTVEWRQRAVSRPSVEADRSVSRSSLVFTLARVSDRGDPEFRVAQAVASGQAIRGTTVIHFRVQAEEMIWTAADVEDLRCAAENDSARMSVAVQQIQRLNAADSSRCCRRSKRIPAPNYRAWHSFASAVV